jgi:2-(1,2-epoxy-1,2-dihydrophenyl)acetyl-CoA isomerase
MSKDSVLIEINNCVATITLNEPKSLNSLSLALVKGLKEAIREVKENNEVRAIILTGNGKAFCAGGNIKEFPDGIQKASIGREYMEESVSLLTGLAQLEKPTVAAVNGYAVGAGFSLALACDFVLATEETIFAMVFNKIGLVPDLGGLYHLPRIVGMARAKEIVFSARDISAKEAKDYGIVLDIVRQEELIEKAQELAGSLAIKATQAIGLSKFILNRSFELSLEQLLQEERFAQAVAFSTDDHAEGIKAFFEKRSPQFSGK